MEELNFTREELEKLDIFNKGGFEGKIYVYDDNLLIKAFMPYLKGILDFEEKRLKLIRLHEKNIDDNILIHPKKLVIVDGEFEGYVMKKLNEGKTINSIQNFKKLVYLYKKLFEKLEVVHDNNIIIRDVKPENIVVEKNEPIFIDVDSMGVDELKADHEGHLSPISKKIPNIYEKVKYNNEKEIDKLKLLACFICSINQNKGTIYKRLMESNLSDKFKREISKIFKADKNLNISQNIHDLFEEEVRKIK